MLTGPNSIYQLLQEHRLQRNSSPPRNNFCRFNRHYVGLKSHIDVLGPNYSLTSRLLAKGVDVFPWFNGDKFGYSGLLCDTPNEVKLPTLFTQDHNLHDRKRHENSIGSYLELCLHRMLDPKTFLNECIVALLLYEECGILGDITLRILGLAETQLAADIVSATPEGASPISYDTPLQNTTQFQSLRRFRYPNAPPTLQDHLETFYYIILYSTYRHSQHTGASSVTKILKYIRENYMDSKLPVITRGSDGLSALIANEARVDFMVTGNKPLTDFLNGTLIGIWAWYAHHQVIEGDSGCLSNPGIPIDEAHVSTAARTLYLYNHKMMRASFEDALAGLKDSEEGELRGRAVTSELNARADC